MVPLSRLLACFFLVALALSLAASPPAVAQQLGRDLGPVQAILQDNRALMEESSRRTIGPAIDAIGSSGLERAPAFLAAWQARSVYQRQSDGLFFIGEDIDGTDQAIDPDTGEVVEEITRDTFPSCAPMAACAL